MIDRGHDLPITRQAQLLGMSRRAVYYLARPASAADLALMRRIDELHLEHPFMGARMLRRQLQRQGVAIGRRHVATLMLRMAISGGNIRITTQLLLPDGSNLRLGGKTVERFRFGSPAGFNVIQAAAPYGVSGQLNVTQPELNVAAALASLQAPRPGLGSLAYDLCEIPGMSQLSVLTRGMLYPAANALLSPLSSLQGGR